MRLTPFLLSQNLSTDNALSTIQVIHQLITQVNTIIKEVNSIDSKANEYTDTQVSMLKTELESDISNLDKQLRNYTDSVAVEVTENTLAEVRKLELALNDAILKVYEDITSLKEELTLYIDTEDSKLKVAIDDVYNELLNIIEQGNYSLYSAYSGEYMSLENALKEVIYVLQGLHGVTWDILVSICETNNITWDMFVERYANGINWTTWNALTYYGSVSLQENCINAEVSEFDTFGNVPMFISSKNKFLQRGV